MLSVERDGLGILDVSVIKFDEKLVFRDEVATHEKVRLMRGCLDVCFEVSRSRSLSWDPAANFFLNRVDQVCCLIIYASSAGL
jgi:hypothetical protein